MLRGRRWRGWLNRLVRAFFVGLLGCIHACSLVVGTEGLQQGCPADQKACGGRCVSRSDPDYGCIADGCRPCVIPQATARCSHAGSCVVAACQGQFADCDLDGDSQDSNGCEVDTAHDPNHCGGCDSAPCKTAHGTADCAGGSCAIQRCDEGHRDCNFDVGDGCEAEVAVTASCE